MVFSPQRRSGSLHSQPVIGSDTANSILENSCLKTQPFFSLSLSLPLSLFPTGILREKNTQASEAFFLFFLLFHPQQPACFSAAFSAALFVRLPGNLTGGSMVLNFHCNKWITGGDPTKVSECLFVLNMFLLTESMRILRIACCCLILKSRSKRLVRDFNEAFFPAYVRQYISTQSR